MDAYALAATTRLKAELERAEELATARRTASLRPHTDGPGSERVFAVAKEAKEFIRVTSHVTHGDLLLGKVAAAVDTARALHSYRLRIRLIRVGVHI